MVGFQSSNCLSSSSVSALSSVLTKSSSSRPRMIHGKTYGLGDASAGATAPAGVAVGTVRCSTRHGLGFGTDVVSRACAMARSYTASS